MIDLTSCLTVTAKPGVPISVADAGGGAACASSFQGALTDLLDAAVGAQARPAGPGERQTLAATGKVPPVTVPGDVPLNGIPSLLDETPCDDGDARGAAGATDSADDDVDDMPQPLDPALAWLVPPIVPSPAAPVGTSSAAVAVPMLAPTTVPSGSAGEFESSATISDEPMPTPAAVPSADVRDASARPNRAPSLAARLRDSGPPVIVAPPPVATAGVASALAAGPAPVAADAAQRANAAAVAPPGPGPKAATTASPQVAASAPDDAPAVDRPVRRAAPAAAPQPTLPPPTRDPVFLRALGSLSGDRPKNLRAPTFDVASQRFADTIAAAPLHAVERMEQPAQAGVDLTDDRGLHQMIDRIEVLRDAADARDTRIRLIPDALGPVAISVHQEGDSIRVHFTATEAGTRQLIADAQPRLTELAEARGLRIERASVDGGATGGQPQSQTPSQPPQSLPANFRNRAPATAEADDATDHRIA